MDKWKTRGSVRAAAMRRVCKNKKICEVIKKITGGYPQNCTKEQSVQNIYFLKRICYTVGMTDYLNCITDGETGEKFAAFYRLLCEYNEKFNLTRITDEKDCRIKHFLDSLKGEKFFPQNAACAEVGSGGGFPSVPLMIARKDLSFTLFESVGKKCAFLETAVKELGLRARVLCMRAEDAGKDPAFRERFDVCCARAVARLNTLSEYCVPLVKTGGRFIAYKGSAAQEEIAEARHALKVLGAREIASEKFLLGEEAGERTIFVAEKERPTPAKYPRGRGKERSDPL